MNAEGILRRSVCEAGDGAGNAGEPGGGGWTRILYCRCENGTLEGSLCLAVVVEAEFVDHCVADRPGMADVPLLKSLVGTRAESRHIRARGLELREWRDQVMIVEIVIKAEVLLVVEAMIKLHGELVAAFGLHRRSDKYAAVVGWSWYV